MSGPPVTRLFRGKLARTRSEPESPRYGTAARMGQLPYRAEMSPEIEEQLPAAYDWAV
jgi:hypothetical protein